MGFLGVLFVVGGTGLGEKLPTPTVENTIMLKISNTLTYLVLQNLPFNTKNPLILLMSAYFLAKNQQFLAKIVPLLKAIV